MSKKNINFDNRDAENNIMLFIKRFAAYTIDILLVVLVGAIIAAPFVDAESMLNLTDSLYEVLEKYSISEIGYTTYMSELIPLTYQLARKSGVVTLATLFVEIMYFIVYQFYHNGQTIGKRLMKIRVVSLSGDMTMNQMLIRSLIINSILIDMIIFGLVIFSTQNLYYYGTLFLERIQNVIVIISLLMIIFGKRSRGLHDLISSCEVISEKVKE